MIFGLIQFVWDMYVWIMGKNIIECIIVCWKVKPWEPTYKITVVLEYGQFTLTVFWSSNSTEKLKTQSNVLPFFAKYLHCDIIDLQPIYLDLSVVFLTLTQPRNSISNWSNHTPLDQFAIRFGDFFSKTGKILWSSPISDSMSSTNSQKMTVLLIKQRVRRHNK